jgi:hypothetical protein
MVTSRSVPQQTAQIFSPLAGQRRSALRFSQMGQDKQSPQNVRTVQQNTLRGNKRQNQAGGGKAEIRRHAAPRRCRSTNKGATSTHILCMVKQTGRPK